MTHLDRRGESLPLKNATKRTPHPTLHTAARKAGAEKIALTTEQERE
jgi:hypothetical protein